MASNNTNIPRGDDEVSLKDLILKLKAWNAYLISKWYIIFASILLGGILGVFYAKSQTPSYIASTTFVLEGGEKGGGLGQYSGMAAMMGIDLGGSSGIFQGENIIKLYQSRAMLEKALLSKTYPSIDQSTELLIERYIAFNELHDKWKERPDLLSVDFHAEENTLNPAQIRIRDSLITSFYNAINSTILKVGKPDKKLSIIQVDVRSSDEDFSKSFNESLVEHVNQFYIQTKTSKSTQNIAVLQTKVDSVRKAMSGAIYSVAHVMDATPNLNPARQVQRIAPTQEAQFSAETNKAILSQLVQNLELTKMNLLQEQPLLQVVDKPIYPLKVESFGTIKGLLIGAFFIGLITVIILVLNKMYNDIML